MMLSKTIDKIESRIQGKPTEMSQQTWESDFPPYTMLDHMIGKPFQSYLDGFDTLSEIKIVLENISINKHR